MEIWDTIRIKFYSVCLHLHLTPFIYFDWTRVRDL